MKNLSTGLYNDDYLRQIPTKRMRRMRSDNFSRRLVRETSLSPADLILPLFVIDDQAAVENVDSMPGVERQGLDSVLKLVKRHPTWEFQQ